MLILSIFLVLSSTAVSTRRDKSILYARSIITVTVAAFILNLWGFNIDFLDKGLGLYHGLFHASAITHIFHLFILLICALILQLNSFYPRKPWSEKFSSLYALLSCKLLYLNSYILNKMAEQFKILEYPLIILFVIVGGTFLLSSGDLISIFLAIELQSYGLYLLCSIYRDSEKAVSAGLTYFLLGGLSSCFILLASGLLYGNSGNTTFDGLYVLNNVASSKMSAPSESLISIKEHLVTWYESSYINFSLSIMSVGFLFKVTAAPFHFWSPDVYDAVPTIVTTFIAIFAKISIFILLLELVHFTSNASSYTTIEQNIPGNTASNFSWTFSLLFSSLFSLVIGSVLGLTQYRIKRLYAYSTISHVGFILLALTINSVESIQSFIFYLMQYSLSNLNAFVVLIAIGFSLYVYIEQSEKDNEKDSKDVNNLPEKHNAISDKKNSPIQLVSQIKGYFYINPFLALSLAITIFSFVGIPPLIGFFAKQMVLSSALDSGYVFMALVAILTSVVSACYYLAVIKQVFFDKPDYIINPQLNNMFVKANVISNINNRIFDRLYIGVKDIKLTGSLTVTISCLTLMIALFILSPDQWLSMANILALILFNS